MRRIEQIDAAQTVLLDGQKAETFAIFLTTSIQRLSIKSISPGQIYVFLLIQDHVGGRTVTWGTEFDNAAPANPRPNSVTVQTCIGSTGGYLATNLPGTWI